MPSFSFSGSCHPLDLSNVQGSFIALFGHTVPVWSKLLADSLSLAGGEAGATLDGAQGSLVILGHHVACCGWTRVGHVQLKHLDPCICSLALKLIFLSVLPTAGTWVEWKKALTQSGEDLPAVGWARAPFTCVNSESVRVAFAETGRGPEQSWCFVPVVSTCILRIALCTRPKEHWRGRRKQVSWELDCAGNDTFHSGYC